MYFADPLNVTIRFIYEDLSDVTKFYDIHLFNKDMTDLLLFILHPLSEFYYKNTDDDFIDHIYVSFDLDMTDCFDIYEYWKKIIDSKKMNKYMNRYDHE